MSMVTKDGRFAPEWIGGAEGIADRVAIVDGTNRLTYGELHRRVTLMVRALRQRGVLPGDRVALVLENSWQYVASYLAVLSAGEWSCRSPIPRANATCSRGYDMSTPVW